MAFDLQPLPLFKEGEGPTILSASRANEIIRAVNALWKIQGTNGVLVTKSRRDVVVNIPGYVPTVCVAVTPAFDFMAFKKWIVIFGSVDLLGPGFNDILPGSGYYVDMAGTTVSTSGWIRTRDNINLTGADTYVLEWQFAGNQRGAQSDEVQVIIRDLTNGGTLFDQTYALTYLTGWTSYTASVTPVADTAISIEFRNPAPSPNSNPAGMLLRGISFRNDTTGETILTDEFGCEATDDLFGGLNGPVYDILCYRSLTDYVAVSGGNRWTATGVYLVGLFSSLNGVSIFNIAKLVPFQGNTVVAWSYTFTVNFDAAAPPLYFVRRLVNAVISATGDLAEKIPAGYTNGGGNWLNTDTTGSTGLVVDGPNAGLEWPITTIVRGGSNPTATATYGATQIHHLVFQDWINSWVVSGGGDTAKLPNYFGTFATGYQRAAAIGYGGDGVALGIMSHNGDGDDYAARTTNNYIGPSSQLGDTPAFEATGIATLEGFDALTDLVDRLDMLGFPPAPGALASSVPNTGFLVTMRRGVDYWRPDPGNVAGTSWYHYDEANPPTRGACLVDWRLAAGQVMPENIGFPTVAFPYWTGAGADCSCYSPVFSGWRSAGTGEFLVVANNVVIDGGTTDWNGARAADFRGMFALTPSGAAVTPFAVNLTFTGLSPSGTPSAVYNHPEILCIDSSDRIWFTGPIATINGTAVTAWQLYYIEGDGSGGTQAGLFGGGKIWSFREFAPDQFIVGGEFTSYLDPNGNDTGAQYLLFIDSAGAQITLTW